MLPRRRVHKNPGPDLAYEVFFFNPASALFLIFAATLMRGSTTSGPTIVGVVKDSSQRSYELPSTGEVYIPYQQFIFATFMSTIVVRTEGEPTAFAPALRKQVWAVDANQPVVKVETMEEMIANSIWRPRFSAWIFSVLSGISVILAAMGVYGVVAYTSALRAREIGYPGGAVCEYQ